MIPNCSGFRRKAVNAGIIFWFMLVASMIIIHFQGGALGDKDWLLMATRMWLSGKRLYVDIFEVNPPFIIWFYAVPSSVAASLGIADYHALVACVLLLVACSTTLCCRVIGFHPFFAGGRKRIRLFAMLVLTTLVLWPNPAYFGDREHLFVVLSLPYIFRFLPSVPLEGLPRWLRLLSGISGGLAFIIKPHCLIFLATLQCYHLVTTHSLRCLVAMETALVLLVAGVYAACVWFFAPEYITDIVPVAAATYRSYSNAVDRFLLYLPPLMGLAVAFADFRLRYCSPFHQDVMYLFSMAVAGWLYAASNNGWLYTFFPLHAFVLLAVVFVLAEYMWLHRRKLAEDAGGKSYYSGIIACVGVLTVNITTILPYCVSLIIPPAVTPSSNATCLQVLGDIVAQKHIKRFGAISLSADIWPPLSRATGAQLVTRYHNLWMLRDFIDGTALNDSSKAWIRDTVATGLSEDIHRNRPDVVFVEQPKAGKAWDLLSYLTGYPEFMSEWNGYIIYDNQPVNGLSLTDGAAECNYRAYLRL